MGTKERRQAGRVPACSHIPKLSLPPLPSPSPSPSLPVHLVGSFRGLPSSSSRHAADKIPHPLALVHSHSMCVHT
jgi:hypothetical protein